MSDFCHRPLKVGEILQETLKLYVRDWRLYIAIVAVVQIPLGVAIAYAWLASDLHSFVAGPTIDPSKAESALGGLFVLMLVVAANFLLTISAIYGSIIQATEMRCAGKTPTFSAAMLFGWNKFLDLVWASIFTGFVLSFVFMAVAATVSATVYFFLVFALVESTASIIFSLFLIGILLLLALALSVYLATKWLFFPQAIVIDGLGAVGSLRRSWRLVGRLYWRTLGISFLLTAVSFGLVSFLTNFVGLLFLIPNIPVSLPVLVLAGTNVALTIVVTPVQMIGLTMAYYDLKARTA